MKNEGRKGRTMKEEKEEEWVNRKGNRVCGFGGNIGHGPLVLYTLSAVQVLAPLDKLNVSYQCGEGCELHCKLQKFGWWIGCTPGGESHAGQSLLLGWVLSSLIMIDRVHWINKEKLVEFILDCQDMENGGISDRPDVAVDVYHTYFGVAGLSLLEYPGLKAIDPTYMLCLLML
ncbi:hypothetical protein SO802_015554 [Lithocarpus litseifolius]|uniref:Geranylgeranyl transferase type II subunit beta n=1 Tax=Lithocarpus litseifolius TaxID=425828 RepID=A0AAW2CU05_9ROSI